MIDYVTSDGMSVERNYRF